MQSEFSYRLLRWFEQHGRCDLPWQKKRTFYRVWVSEIMLQQTQVITVIPYYERFMQTFPDINTLADAELDKVLYLWAGLGYYARARNLHKTAKIIINEYGGRFPNRIDELMRLPGIGRSTAGAILSLVCKQRHPILDGNVKRVLCRFHAISGYPEKKDVAQRLWQLSETYIPEKGIAAYTQAMMDLGAMVCKKKDPQCNVCPLNLECEARKQSRQHDYPQSKMKKNLPKKKSIFAIIENNRGEFLLEQRPPTGIWGGLWCFPEFTIDEAIIGAIKKKYGFKAKKQREHNAFKHSFSHFELMIKPVHFKINDHETQVNDSRSLIWLDSRKDIGVGFPNPVVLIIKRLNGE